MKHPDNPDEKDNQPCTAITPMGFTFWIIVKRAWDAQERDAWRAWAAQVEALWEKGTAA